MDSVGLSSYLMYSLARFRNGYGFNLGERLISEVGFTIVPLVALVETVAAAIFLFIAPGFIPFCADPLDPYKFGASWILSSSFCIPWAITDCFLNLFSSELSERQEDAFQWAKDIFRL